MMQVSCHGQWYMETYYTAHTGSFNNVAQLHAPTGAHLTKATEMLQARVEKVAREEGPGWTQFKEQTVTGAWHGI